MTHGTINLGLQNDVIAVITRDQYNLVYYTEDIEVIDRKQLQKLRDLVNHDNVLFSTNAGLDLHSSENDYKGIKFNRENVEQIHKSTLAMLKDW